ncbi:MAG: ribonuclease P protein subunit [Candidatus Nanohaloarchaeota archaeon QJJ-5]|nr:ribonuclease P protein subunit [Candidatus Nanohaloarchaeota archaeon QJJ-5]
MTRTPGNLPRHELVGLAATVIEAPDPTQIGIGGTIVDETRNMLVLEDDDRRQIPKQDRVFRIRGDHLKVQVNGNLLHARPVERMGQHLPRTWGYVNER